jgi:long-chain-alcohol oxidase
MVRYSRTAHIFAMVRDRGSGEEGGVCLNCSHFRHHPDEIDKENLKTGSRKASRIFIAAGAMEVGDLP